MLLLGGAALALTLRHRDISNPNVEFKNAPAQPPAPAPKQRGNVEASFEWPVYGYSKQRTREFRMSDPSALHPPYHEKWAERGRVLLEFPPVLGRRALYMLKNNGALYALSRKSGRVLWKKKVNDQKVIGGVRTYSVRANSARIPQVNADGPASRPR